MICQDVHEGYCLTATHWTHDGGALCQARQRRHYYGNFKARGYQKKNKSIAELQGISKSAVGGMVPEHWSGLDRCWLSSASAQSLPVVLQVCPCVQQAISLLPLGQAGNNLWGLGWAGHILGPWGIGGYILWSTGRAGYNFCGLGWPGHIL